MAERVAAERGQQIGQQVSSNKMALITSDCDAMRIHEHQMALITSEVSRSDSRFTPPR